MKEIKIKTERLTLVPLTMEYFDEVHEYTSDAENTKFMMFLPHDTEDETREFLRGCEEQWNNDRPDYYEFGILCGDGFAGGVSLYREEESDVAELGWIIRPCFHRRGVAFEAAKALIEYGIKELGFTHFIAHCDTENTPSRRLMEKLGMKQTGESGGRFNKGSDEERREYTYELTVDE